MEKNKKLALLTTAVFTAVSFLPSAVMARDLSALAGLAGLGLKMNDRTRYVYSLPKGLNAVILCRATNSAAKYPKSGETGSYACHLMKTKSDSYFHFPTGYVTGSLQYDGTGKQRITLEMAYSKVEGYEEGIPKENQSTIPITIVADVGDTATAISPSSGVSWNDPIDTDTTGNGKWDGYVDDPWAGFGDDNSSSSGGTSDTEWDNSFPRTDPDTEYNNGKGPCSDGSYFCPEETRSHDDGTLPTPDTSWQSPTNTDGSQNTPSDTPQDSSGNGGGNEYSDGGDTPSKTLPEQTWERDTGDGGIDYGNIIDDMLGDDRNSSFDSPNVDWSISNGNGGDDGDTDLDDYFNGIEDTDSIPEGMTEDLGLGGLSEEVTDGGSADSYTWNEGDNGNVSYDGSGSEDGGGYYDDSGDTGFPATNNGVSSLSDDIAAAYDEALGMLDGSGSKGDGGNSLLGDMGGDDSLASRIKKLTGDDSSLFGTKKGSATEQDLGDMAKDMLQKQGYNLSDIASGHNYDANSAYTEPSYAWDMNRITTLMRGKKLSLSNPKKGNKQGKNGKTLTHTGKPASLPSAEKKK